MSIITELKEFWQAKTARAEQERLKAEADKALVEARTAHNNSKAEADLALAKAREMKDNLKETTPSLEDLARVIQSKNRLGGANTREWVVQSLFGITEDILMLFDDIRAHEDKIKNGTDALMTEGDKDRFIPMFIDNALAMYEGEVAELKQLNETLETIEDMEKSKWD